MKKKTEAEKKLSLILDLKVALDILLDAEQVLKKAIEDYRDECCQSPKSSNSPSSNN